MEINILLERLHRIQPDEKAGAGREPVAATEESTQGIRSAIKKLEQELEALAESDAENSQMLRLFTEAQLRAFETLLRYDGNYQAAIQALKRGIREKGDDPSLELAIKFVERLHAEGQKKINFN